MTHMPRCFASIFLSTLSLRRATIDSSRAASFQQHFYPRSPCGERRFCRSLEGRRKQISIHALLAESDHKKKKINPTKHLFLSTLSLRRATINPTKQLNLPGISIHALLAESDSPPRFCYLDNIISIHALLAESDHTNKARGERINRFLSTLSLRRATLTSVVSSAGTIGFLSTLSLRRATLRHNASYNCHNISIHALLAESDKRANSLADAPPKISIHALLAESDNGHEQAPYKVWISIHALLAESDNANLRRHRGNNNFYPRSPCGERLHRTVNIQRPATFLSTLSLRRAT